MSEYAGLHILKSPYHIDNAFDYFIPPHLRNDIRVGDFVTVPFGVSNKREIALVISLKDFPDNKDKACKPIISICEKEFSLSEEMQKLCLFMKEQTLCTVGDAVKSLIPSSVLTKPYEVYRFKDLRVDGLENKLDSATLFIYEYIKKKGTVPLETLKAKFGPATKPAIQKLTAEDLIVKDFEIRESSKKAESYYELSITQEQAQAIKDRTDTEFRLRSLSHIGIVSYFLLHQIEKIEEKKLMEACVVNYSQLKALCDKGILKKSYKEIDRGLAAISASSTEHVALPISLSEEQNKAFETLRSLCDCDEAKAALLYGVTGSGKTSVMLKTIDHVLSAHKSVIVLLPEISLTPQTLEIFCSRYGKRVAIIHSGLSDGERLDTYKRIKRSGADVVIGTRSAVFAPVSNLGLIIIDEEQEHTYKSDKNPKYHARDIARFRCSHHKALMLLASATPSFESFYKAEQGIYSLVRLTKRYGNAQLPKVSVVDMRKSANGVTSPLGNLLCEKLVQTKADGNQSILFINRRGYNNFFSCRSCGKAITCPTCSVSMTYHTFGSSYDSGELRCHWCGKRIPTPAICPECGSEHLARMGYGTQRIEQELGELLPSAKILRMDTDTTSTKNAYEELLGTFRSRNADVLLGTQMVTKGHDFPAVTLVGVLLADTSLYLDDYRAAERTFAMLTQVIGRAGRADKAGEAVIQTSNPDNECIRLACAQDYDTFYKNEIRLRRQLRFPPFCDIALLTLTSPDEKELVRASTLLSQKFGELVEGEYKDLPLIAFGPFEAPVYKVENKYRMRMVIKCRLNKRSRAMFSSMLTDFSKSGAKNLSLSIDFNPSNL